MLPATHRLAAKARAVAASLAVFVGAALVCAWVQNFPGFRDPDTFYHLKMVELVRDHGMVREFPWLPYTSLARDYTDHHWLYHLLLVPFIVVLPPLQGMLVGTVFFAALAVTAFFAVLRAHGVRWSAAYALVLLGSPGFLFRLNLGKASAASIAVLCLAILLIRKNKPWATFALAWAYVLLHGGWPLIAIVSGAFLVSRIVVDHLHDVHPWRSWSSHWYWRRVVRGAPRAWQDLKASPEARGFLATIAGLCAGLVVNPSFPTNFRFYREQILEIAVRGYRGTIGVGAEWYPYDPAELLSAVGPIYVLFILALGATAFVLVWPEYSRQRKFTREEAQPLVAVALLALTFFGLVLRSKRHIEYFSPFMAMALALWLNAVVRRIDAAAAIEKLRDFTKRPRVLAIGLGSWFAALLLFLLIRSTVATHDLYRKSVPFHRYEGAAGWIRANAPEDAIVFHSDWDIFPLLFLYDTDRRYIVGLDPTFFYRADPRRYRLWVDITQGRVARPAAIVRDDFRSEFVLVQNSHKAMLDQFERDPSATKTFSDKDATVFAL